VIGDLIESGVDAINPLECKANMDLRELAPQWGDRLGFVGGIDVRVLMTNDPEQIREEVRAKLGAAMPHNGYICHSDHSVPPGVTLESYRLLLEEVRTVGRYD
jgi:uroporphyrinogen decarboxylase